MASGLAAPQSMPASAVAATKLRPGDRSKEFVSGGRELNVGAYYEKVARVLSQKIDDLSIDFGDRVYDEMMTDGAVSAQIDTLKSWALAEPCRFVASITDTKDPGYERAKRNADFITRQFKHMARPLTAVLHDILDCLIYGSSVSEIVYKEPAIDRKLGRIVQGLRALKPKHRRKVAFVVDKYMNVLGVMNREAGGVATGSMVAKLDPANIVPREKLAIMSYGGRNGDPRGMSVLRAVWTAYAFKTQILPEWIKYLIHFGTPALVGYTPEKGTNENIQLRDPRTGAVLTDSNGDPLESTAEQLLLETLLDFQGSAVMSLKGGTKVDLVESEGTGEAFIKAFEVMDRQIAMAILKSARTTMEAKNSSKADGESAADITAAFVDYIRELVADMLTKDVVYQLILVNFGEEDAEDFCPEATLGGIEKQDFSAAATAMAALWAAGLLHISQIEGIWAMLGLPKGDVEAMLNEYQDKLDQQASATAERSRLINPLQDNPPKPSPKPKAKPKPEPKAA